MVTAGRPASRTRSGATGRRRAGKGPAEAQFRRLAETSLQAILIHDGRRRMFANAAYARLFGYPNVADVLTAGESGQHVFPEDLPALEAEWDRILTGRQSWSRQRCRRRALDGSLRWVDLVLGPITWEGQPAIQGIQIDVTREVEAVEELARNEARFRRLFEDSMQGLVIHDGRRRLFVNRAFTRMMGYPDVEAALADTVWYHVPPELRDAVADETRQTLAGNQSWSRRRVQRYRIDGSTIWIDLTRGPIVWDDRPAVQVAFTDVTAQVEAEVALRRSEHRLRSVIDNLPQILIVKDTERRIQLVNRAFENAFGMTAAEVVGKTADELPELTPLGRTSAAEIRADDMAVLESGSSLTRERLRVKPTGEPWDSIRTTFAMHDADGAVDGIGAIVTDVTVLKQAQAQLERRRSTLQRHQEALLRILHDELSGGPPAARIRRTIGLAAEALGVDTASVWRLDEETATLRCVERWLARVPNNAEQPFPMALPLTLIEPMYRALDDRLVVVLDSERPDPAIRAIFDEHYPGIDVTAALCALIRLPGAGRVHVAFSQCDARHVWSDEDETFARSVAELIRVCFLQEALEQRELALRRNQETLIRIVREGLLGGGTTQEILDTIARVAGSTLDLRRVAVWMCGELVDTSDRVCVALWEPGRAQRPIPRQSTISAEKLHAWFTDDYVGRLQRDFLVAIDDVETDPLLSPAGRAFCRETGTGARLNALVQLPERVAGVVTFHAGPGPRRWSVEDRAFARSVADLVAFVFLSERHRQALAALDLVGHGIYVDDGRGEVIYANRVARRLAGVDDAAPVRLPLLPAPPANAAGEVTWQSRGGEALALTVVRTALPSAGAVTVIADVTERKRREHERRALEAEMQQAAKLEAVGRLAGGIAHDFNNLIGTVLGFASFLQEDLPRDSQQHGYAERIIQAIGHAKEVVKQLLAFTRTSEVERRVLDLRKLVRDTQELLRASLPSSTELMIDAGRRALPALVNGTHIHQILLNLCINANDALGGEPGVVALALTQVTAGADVPMSPSLGAGAASVAGGRLRPGHRYARLTVTDGGSGMDAATLARVFDPFFTTKSPGRGTGLGLAVVHGIVASYEGAYLVESEIGRGTSFSIFLPLAESAAPVYGVVRVADAAWGSESILVIDDERDLLDMMCIGLERLGYRATGCSDPLQALAAFRAEPTRWAAVVTDEVMPGLKGCALVAKLREIRPDCPIVLCTGFSDGTTERQARQAGAADFFLKPVEPAHIAATIRALLDTPPPPDDPARRRRGSRARRRRDLAVDR